MQTFKSVAPDYEVSNLGNVKSYWNDPPRILTPVPNKDGYLRVNLHIGGKSKFYYIHRLVAEAFIPNPEGKPQINHRNGIKTDNRIENLEWCTQSENNRHAYATGLRVMPQGVRHYKAKLTNEQVVYIRDNPDGLSRKALAEKFGVKEITISLIQLGKTYKTAGGTAREPKRPRVPGDVRDEIRRLYKRGVYGCGARALAKRFGVNPMTILNIVNNE